MRDLQPFLALLKGAPRRRLVAGTLLSAAALAAGLGLLGLAGWLIAACALAGAGGVMFSYLVASGGVRAAALTRTLARYGDRLLNHRATLGYLSALRLEVFRRAAALPPLRLSAYRSGDLLERLLGDIGTLDTLLVRVVVPSISIGLVTLLTLLGLGRLAPTLAWAVAAFALGLGVVLPTAVALLTNRAGAGVRNAKAELRTHLIESAQGSREIRSYGAEAFVAAGLNEKVSRVAGSSRRLHHAEALAGGLAEVLIWGGLLLGLRLSVASSRAGGLTPAQVVLVTFLVLALLEGVAELPGSYRHLGQARRAAARLGGLLGRSIAPPPRTLRAADLPGPAGQLELRGVTFGYPGREAVLADLSCTFGPGRTTALVGPSGRGKTTLLRVLAGELEPQRGGAHLGGVRLGPDVDPARLVTYVGQEPYLFTGTLRENLQVAAPGAAEPLLWRALEAACLDDFVGTLPGGLDTWVQGSGVDLSGGQRRRLALAQAVLRRPRVLLLDEPSADLDLPTARRVLSGLRRALPEATFVVATHAPGLFPADATLRLEAR